MQHDKWVLRYLKQFRKECPRLPANWEAVQLEDDSNEHHLAEMIAAYPDAPEQAAIEALIRMGYLTDDNTDSNSVCLTHDDCSASRKRA